MTFCHKDVSSDSYLQDNCPAAGLSTKKRLSIVDSYRRTEWSEGAIRAWHERERRITLLREALGFVDG